MRARALLRTLLVAPLLVSLGALSACGAPSSSDGVASNSTSTTEQAFASAHGVLLDFEFDGHVTSSTSVLSTLKSQIATQLQYTVGQLNHDSSVGRFERLELTNIVPTADGAGGFDVTYHAKLPVAWGRLAAVPTSYTLKVPRAGTVPGIEAWVAAHNTTCIDFEGSGSDRYSFWYYYRPEVAGCVVSATDSAILPATVTRSPENTVGKYPEYDKVWSDGELHVVAMFGRNESGATASTDAGIRDYNTFVSSVRSYVRSLQPDATQIVETPGITSAPGSLMPQVNVTATLPMLVGELTPRKIKVDVMLTGYRLYQDGVTFDTWYEGLTPTADMILYNGHAGLGENVRYMMNHGIYAAGQYTIWMSNGCDTFAYVDPTLANKVSAANGGAPATQFLDTVTNAMPSYFTRTPGGSMTMIRALADFTAPKTYPQIFQNIDPAQIVVVTGEEDNTFDATKPVVPGVPPGGPVVPDAGVGDGGVIFPDGGTTSDGGVTTPDASTGSDAGTGPTADAGSTPSRDAGTSTPSPTNDAGAPPAGDPESPEGCACETAPGRPGGQVAYPIFGLAALAGVLVGRRRRNT